MFVKLTIHEAKNLRPGQILHWTGGNNSDGTPMRYKVNGKVKTWITRPKEFRIPVKRGLYEYAYVTEKEIDQFFLEVHEDFSRFEVFHLAGEENKFCTICNKEISFGWMKDSDESPYCTDCVAYREGEYA